MTEGLGVWGVETWGPQNEAFSGAMGVATEYRVPLPRDVEVTSWRVSLRKTSPKGSM